MKSIINRFFVIYGIFLTFVPYVYPNSQHYKYVLFAFFVAVCCVVLPVLLHKRKQKKESD